MADKSLPGPMQFLREAIKAVPAVKWALGVGGIASVVAIVAAFGIDVRVAGIGVVIMIPLMMLLVVFARAATLTGQAMRTPALVLAWFVLIVFMAVSAALVTSVFFDRPVPLRHWLSRISPAETTTSKTVIIMDSSLPGVVYSSPGREPGTTNFNDLFDLLRGLPGFQLNILRELTYPTWLRDDEIRKQNPDLIILHASCFYSETTPSDPSERLTSFLHAMEPTRTKFLIYSRDAAAETALADSGTSATLKGRLSFYVVRGGSAASFRDPKTARDFKERVASLLSPS